MNDREALTTLILGLTAPRAADAILASEWLARVKAEAKAEGYREALEREPAKVQIENHEAVRPFMDHAIAEAKAEGIAEFVNEQSVRYRKHSGAAIEEDIALAIGHFGVPVEEFYSDGLPLDSDYLIAQIERHRIARAALVDLTTPTPTPTEGDQG